MKSYNNKRRSRWDDFIQGRLTGDYKSKDPGGGNKIHLGETKDGKKVGYSPIEGDTLRMMIVGPSGKGKTRLMDDICRQVMIDDERPSLVVIDPKPTQDLYRSILKFSLDKGFRERLHFLDPTYDYLPGYNLMELKDRDADTQAKNMMDARLKAWDEEDVKLPNLRTWGYNTDRTLIETGLTLNESQYLTDTLPNEYRKSIVSQIENQGLRREWEKILALKLAEREMKLGVVNRRTKSFLNSDPIWTMVSQKENVLKLDKVFNRGDILLVTLPQRKGIHPDDAQLLGRLLVNDIITAAAYRAEDARPVYLVIDEFSQMVSKDVGEILDLGRSSNLNFIFGHQHLAQVREKDLAVFYSELTNTNVQAVFGGLTKDDLDTMANEFYLQEYDPKRVKEERYRTFYKPVDEEVTEETRTSRSSRSDSETEKEREGGEEVTRTSGTSSSEDVSRTTRHITTHRERTELAAREFYSLQEQQLLAEQELRRPPQQWLNVRINYGRPALIKAPTCYEPELHDDVIDEGKEKIVEATEVYSSREDVRKEVDEREKKLKRGKVGEKTEPDNFVN